MGAQNNRALVPAILLSIWLAACGGGGGGSPDPVSGAAAAPAPAIPAAPASPAPAPAPGAAPTPSPVPSADGVGVFLRQPTRMDATLPQGGGVGGLFNFGLSGDVTVLANKTVFVVVEDPDKFYAQGTSVSFDLATSTGKLVLTGQILPAVRHHVGELRFFVCMDAACTVQVAGSPLVVPYDVNVIEGVKLDPVSPVAVEIAPNRTDVTIPLTLTVPPHVLQEIHIDSPDIQWSAAGKTTSNGIAIADSPDRQAVTLQLTFSRQRQYDKSELSVRVITKGSFNGVATSLVRSTSTRFNVNTSQPTVGSNLTALTPLPGAAAWTTLHGNAAHEGYVPAEVDPMKFSQRFVWTAEATGPFPLGFSPVVAADGLACFAIELNGSTADVACLSEQTGLPVWRQSLRTSSNTTVGLPALSSGRLHVAAREFLGNTPGRLMSFDLATGTPVSTIDTDLGAYDTPIVDAGSLFAAIGQGIGRLDIQSGLITGCACTLPTTSFTAVTLAGEKLLALSDGKLYELNRRTMAVIRTTDVPGYQGGYPVVRARGAVVAQGATVAYGVQPFVSVYDSALVKFDLMQGTVAWHVKGLFDGNPVVVGDTVYVRADSQFQARSAVDGSLRWAYNIGGATDMVVVGSHAFVSSGTGTVALNLQTRQAVWRHEEGGASLSVSPNGILYIGSVFNRSKMTAVNLR